MNTKIDLKNAIVKEGMDFLLSRMNFALQFSERLENAVIPIYFPLKSAKPEQIGSGVVVQIEGKYFIFSASHIFDVFQPQPYHLLIGLGNGKKLASLPGERLSSAKGISGTHRDDPIDASVYCIQSHVPDDLEKIALSLDDLDSSPFDITRSVHIAAGFRSRKSETVRNQAYAKREGYPLMEYGEEIYSLFNLERKIHLAVTYENKVLVGAIWQASPKPRGMSGGALIRVEGVSLFPGSECSNKPKPLLTAVIIECRKGIGKKPGVLIGTRIGVHIGLLYKYFPELFRDKTT